MVEIVHVFKFKVVQKIIEVYDYGEYYRCIDKMTGDIICDVTVDLDKDMLLFTEQILNKQGYF